jgi:hypothetical protein
MMKFLHVSICAALFCLATMGEELLFMGTAELPHAPSNISFAPSGHHFYVDYHPRDEREIWHAIYTDMQRKTLHKKTLAWPSGSWHQDDVLYAVNWSKGIALPEYTRVLDAMEGRATPVFEQSAERLSRADGVTLQEMPELDFSSATTLDRLAIQAWEYAEQGKGALAIDRDSALFSTLPELSAATIAYFGDTHREERGSKDAMARKALEDLAAASRVYLVNEKDERLNGRIEDPKALQMFMMSGGEKAEVTTPDLQWIRTFDFDDTTNQVLVSLWGERYQRWFRYDATTGERFDLPEYDSSRRALLNYELVPARNELAVDVEYLDECHLETISRSLELWDFEGNFLSSVPLSLPRDTTSSQQPYGRGDYWLSSQVVVVLWTEQAADGETYSLQVYRRQ